MRSATLRVAAASQAADAASFFRLEQFDEGTGWIYHPNLRAARTTHDVITTELHSGSAKPCHLDFDVSNLQLDAIPTAGYRLLTVGHVSPPCAYFPTDLPTQ